MRSKAKSNLKVNHLVVLTLAFFSLISWFVSTTTQASSPIMVTTAADNGNNANPTPGSLREAIITANNTVGTDTINFSIGTGAQTILPPSALPAITGPVIIDGTTQPGYAGAPLIELDGTGAGAGAHGLNITAGNSTVRALVINRFNGNGININTAGSNSITGCYIGTNAAGTAGLNNNQNGIQIRGNGSNTIGGTTAAARNVISGNNNHGIRIQSPANVVQGN